MKKRKLGRTGLEVSEIGYGTWGMGKTLWRDGDDAQSRKSLQYAFDRGVNFYDTALVYGSGHSESLIGELAKKNGRDKIIVATKIPPLNMQWPAKCGVPLKETFPPSHIRKSTETSLKNLKTDYIDLQQLHVWQDHWLEQDEWKEELLKLKKEGKIRFAGASINDHDPQSAILLAQEKIADVVQVIYNIYDQSPEEALFPLCQEMNIGVIIRCPFDEGGLTGNITPKTTFPEGDFRNNYFKDHRKKEVEEHANRLKTVLGAEAKTLPELALRYTLSNPVVSTVIPGMRKPNHVEMNLAVSDGKTLSKELLEVLRTHAWPRNFYS